MSRAQATAMKLLERYGMPVTITATDEATGQTTQREAFGAIIGTPRYALNDAVPIELGDELLLVSSSGQPERGARIAYIERDRVVAYSEAIHDGSTVAVWRVLARRG